VSAGSTRSNPRPPQSLHPPGARAAGPPSTLWLGPKQSAGGGTRPGVEGGDPGDPQCRSTGSWSVTTASEDGLALTTRGLVKRYGKVVALDGLDLSVPTGVVYGFLGPTGAGKPTTMRLLTGLLPAE